MKIALIQLTSGADMAENIRRVGALVGKAAGKGAQFIATPENVFLMADPHPGHLPKRERGKWTMETHPGVRAAAGWAKKHKLWLLAGSVAISPDAGRGPRKNMDSGRRRNYNRSLLFNPQGKIAAQYDKIHLFDVEVGDGQVYRESARMLAGNRAVMAQLPAAKLGMTICYDLRFPQLYRSLAKAGAEILAVPAAFTQTTGRAHWHVLLRARAIENGCFVIAPAQTGTHPGGRKTYGHSLVVNPWGEVIADGGTKEGIVMAEIDLGEVKKARGRIPSLMHDRKF